MWLARGDPARARQDCDKAIEADPRSDLAFLNRAMLRRDAGDHDGALEDLEQAIALKSRNAEALVIRAGILAARRDVDGALRDPDRAIAADPKFIGADLNRALLRSRKGDRRLAAADAAKVVELNPKEARGWFLLGHCLRESGDFDGAIRALTRLIELDSRAPDPDVHRALAREAKGDVRGAIEDGETALRLGGSGWEGRAGAESYLATLRRRK